MEKTFFEEQDGKTLKELFPHLNDDEIHRFEESLEKYVGLVLRIFERTYQQDSDLTE